MTPELAALLGAGIGAAGALIGGLLTEVFTARRERERLNFERSQQFLELKRHLFSSFLQITREVWARFRAVDWQLRAIDDPEEMIEELIASDDGYHKYWLKRRPELDEIVASFGLLAPSVERPALELMEVLDEWSHGMGSHLFEADDAKTPAKRSIDLRYRCRELMQVNLGLPPSPTPRTGQTM